MQPVEPNHSIVNSPSMPDALGTTTPPVVVPVVSTPATLPAALTAASPATAPRPIVIERNQVEIWDVPFDVITLDQSLQHISRLIHRGEPSYVITANLNYVMLHHRNDDLRAITRDADLIVADGQPIVWRSKLGDRPLPERVAGSEMIYEIGRYAGEKGWSIYFLGGEAGVAQSCATELARLYPGMKIAGVESPPFRPLTDPEQRAQDHRIQTSGADILLVAFGQPKGELWIHEHYKRLGVPVNIQLGASFDFVAGNVIRAPKICQAIGMEWFYRMVSDPRRLVKRYATNAWFLATALAQDWKRKVHSWGMGIE
ncbi:MAG: WecB/TagA/CpsF family glycosyltransferase [Pirellulaceae bacterium]|nr:WecB/TagA/CpsF family glycosyltransferase [Pirellulaceae bacterium]